MAKMKKIDHIVRGKGTESSKYEFRKGRIERTLDSLIKDGEEAVVDYEYKANEVLNTLSQNADTSDAIVKVLNQYIDYKATIDSYNESVKILKELKAELKKEIDVEEEEEK